MPHREGKNPRLPLAEPYCAAQIAHRIRDASPYLCGIRFALRAVPVVWKGVAMTVRDIMSEPVVSCGPETMVEPRRG